MIIYIYQEVLEKINSIKFNIEKLNELPVDKQSHSMLYIPKRYIYFIGGNNKKTFFYDIFFSSFNSWANMNKSVKNPTLILLNNIFIYSFGNPDKNNPENMIGKPPKFKIPMGRGIVINLLSIMDNAINIAMFTISLAFNFISKFLSILL